MDGFWVIPPLERIIKMLNGWPSDYYILKLDLMRTNDAFDRPSEKEKPTIRL